MHAHPTPQADSAADGMEFYIPAGRAARIKVQQINSIPAPTEGISSRQNQQNVRRADEPRGESSWTQRFSESSTLSGLGRRRLGIWSTVCEGDGIGS